MPPPAVRAAVLRQTSSITETDLADLAREADLRLIDGAVPRSTLAKEVTEALRNYALAHRMDRASARSGEVEKWAAAMHRWASEGLHLLGGTLDDNATAVNVEYWLPHSIVAQRFSEAWEPSGAPIHLIHSLLHGTAHYSDSTTTPRSGPNLHDVVHRSAAAIELFLILTSSLKERAASLSEERAAADHRERRPAEYAHLELFRALAGLYKKLHGREATVVRAPARTTSHTKHEQLPGGPALTWLRGLFTRVAVRADDPVISTLANWAQRTDAMAEVLRKVSAERRRAQKGLR